MCNEITGMLDEEIKREIESMASLNPGDEGYSEATERLAKLYKLRIDEKQVDSDILDKEEQAVQGNKDRWIRVGVEVGLFAATMIFNGVWMRRGFKFEETGSLTSSVFRSLWGRFGFRK